MQLASASASASRSHAAVSLVLRHLPLAVAFAYSVHESYAFIVSSSFELQGHRYFSLFDDAMISMRYAWNLAHGHGLVWNPGERIEGFTNPLWTLVMSFATLVFTRAKAVLAMQVLGASLLAAAAGIFAKLAGRLFRGSAWPLVAIFEAGFFLLLTETFPLRFWTHMGMEVSALLLVTALAWWQALRPPRDERALGRLGVLVAVAFLVRPDGMLVAVSPLALRLLSRPATRLRLLVALGPLVASVVVTTLLRVGYYGDWLPNTYRLKMGRFPLSFRLVNGCGFVRAYVGQVAPLFALGAISCVLARRRRTLALAAAPLLLLAYQVYVGGDPWPYWRQMTPGYPLLLWLAIHPVVIAAVRLRRRFPRARWVRHASPVVTLAILAAGLSPTWAAFADGGPLAFNVAWNRINVERALVFRKILKPDARIAVFWGGATPYYDADRYAIDLLGKSDRVVADQASDLSGAISGDGMQTVPGHNKSQLRHSLVELDADYTESIRIGRDQLRARDLLEFRKYTIRGSVYWMRRTSKRIDWAALEAVVDPASEGDEPRAPGDGVPKARTPRARPRRFEP